MSGYRVSQEKARIAQETVMYLGFEIFKGHRQLSVDRKEAICRLLEPNTLRELRTFLGMTGWCHLWIDEYGLMVLDVGNMNDWQRKSPLDWETYVNKMVKVAAIEKHEYEGWVLTVDPVSASIVLATFLENEKVSISIVLGHAVQEVEILKEGDDEMKQRLSCIFAPEESKAYSPEELEKRKNNLKTWLETNHIPVTEQGESGRTLCVAGVLTIDPPYGPEECSSSNEIILSRVQGLIQGYLEKQE
ncbi:gem-associated protein 6 isoform X1 [Buteo buteo]